MRMIRRPIAAVTLLAVTLASTGCSTLREVPRSEYGARAERKAVRVWTTEGLEYEFDYATVAQDTLTGYRHRDVEGLLDQVAVLHFALADIQRMSARGIDWKRTSLVGGGLVASVLAAGLTKAARNDDAGGSSSGGGGGRGF